MTDRRHAKWFLVTLAAGLALVLGGCKAKSRADEDSPAKRAEADWKERVDQARKYAERRKGGAIESAVGVKELPGRGGVEQPGSGPQVVTLTATTTPEERARLRERVKSEIPIVMYATSWCGVCAAARGYMKSANIRYSERDVERESDAQLACLSINPRCSVPTFDVDGLVMVGFRGKRFDAMIERATDLRMERMMERQPKTLIVTPAAAK